MVRRDLLLLRALCNSSAPITGYTPLHIAFMKRHWDTARLILAIAAAQYSPVDLKAPTAPKFVSTRRIARGQNRI